MSENLYQIVNMDDLYYFLRGGKDKLINLSLVLLTTDENVKRMIKKFVKRKSEQYPGATFLYYAVRKEDMGGRISFMSNDPSEYPKMCHIFNIHELLSEVRAIDNVEILERSFQHPDIMQYYARFGTIVRKPISNVVDEDNGYIENDENDENDEDDESETEYNNKKKINNNSTNKQNIMVPKMQEYQPAQNPVLEKKKLLEKLTLIRQKGEEYNMQFLEECRKRKKEEEEDKSKQKNKEKNKTK